MRNLDGRVDVNLEYVVKLLFACVDEVSGHVIRSAHIVD